MDEQRESIWSVPRNTKSIFYLGFSFFMTIGALGVLEAPPPEGKSVLEVSHLLLAAMAPITIASAGLTILIIELSVQIGEPIVVMGSWIAQKLRELQQKEFASKVDKKFGKGTFERLEKSQTNPQNGEAEPEQNA